MSYDVDEEGNKTFYEPELERDEDKMYGYWVHYAGKVYIEALDEDEALYKFMKIADLEHDDIEVVRE